MSTSMNFELFKESVIQIVKEKLGEEYRVLADDVIKNNGIVLTGIIIQEPDNNTSPTIYINSFYEDYLRGVSIMKITDAICEVFSQNRHIRSVDMSHFTNYEEARKQIAYKLVHYDKNRKLLENIPHRQFYNLAVVFYYIAMEEPFFGKASIMITNAHLRHWNIDEQTLYRDAEVNTPNILPAQIENIEEVMLGLLKKQVKDEKHAEDLWEQIHAKIKGEADTIPMYVLSNTSRCQGAACMLYPEVLKNFANKIKKDLFILPSSIHEVIILPAMPDMKEEELLSMVTEINATQVEESEVLADSIYCYFREKDSLEYLC